jgi:hypothetical protein
MANPGKYLATRGRKEAYPLARISIPPWNAQKPARKKIPSGRVNASRR